MSPVRAYSVVISASLVYSNKNSINCIHAAWLSTAQALEEFGNNGTIYTGELHVEQNSRYSIGKDKTLS